MEWPQELLEIFDDPLLADVKPKPIALTADDRKVLKLQEIAAWIQENGHEPTMSGALNEKLLCRALAALRKEIESLKPYDTTNIL